MSEKLPRLSKKQVANTGEFLHWLIDMTWHSGEMYRRHKDDEGPGEKETAALLAGEFFASANCLSRYTDRDIDKIHEARSLDELYALVKDGKSWWEAIERQTRKQMKEMGENA